ncbi:MAG: hypothetical protein J1F43_02795 [Muribaculaceae bacterium]|nr:hypothetical protein [Muribaculaceae bacterium]
MKQSLKIFIYCFLAAVLWSCKDDLWVEKSGSDNSFGGDNGVYSFNLQVDAPEIRSRAVDFNSATSIRLNQVWIGIFDKTSGKIIDYKAKPMDYKTVATNMRHDKIIKLEFDPPTDNEESQDYIVVCLANYVGVLDDKGEDIETRLSNVQTWQEFNDIAIDAVSAYSSPHNTTTPVLAGFLYNNKVVKDDTGKEEFVYETTHIKIDQFEEAFPPEDRSKDEIFLSPATRVPDVCIKGNKDGYSINEQTVLKLRRLVANINVNITKTDNARDLLLTDVTYKRFNMPKAVYIIERKTTDCQWPGGNTLTPGNFPRPDGINPLNGSKYGEKANTLTANFADLDPANWYYDDTDWQYGNISGFSFQHFANKHWSNLKLKEDLTSQTYSLVDSEDHEVNRAQRNKKGAFTALVGENGEPTDYNNYASYFVVKMHFVDAKNGRAYEAEYTILEGNTSDELGEAVANTWDEEYKEISVNGETIKVKNYKGNPKDFVCARNLNYTYNIYIDGVNNIWHNVEPQYADDDFHAEGQGGRVWNIHYMNDQYNSKHDIDPCRYDHATGSFYNAVSYEGGMFENALVVDNINPDMAFRLYGYNTESGHIEGFNYNFPDQSFQWLNTLWPESAGSYSHYFKNYDELVNPTIAQEKDIPANIIDGLRIIDPTNAEHMKYQEVFDDEDRENDEIKRIEYIREHTWSIKDFIAQCYVNEKAPDYTNEKRKEFNNRTFHVWIGKSPIDKQNYFELNKFVRVIYIADRKGHTDKDDCTTRVDIYSIAQYPDFIDGTDKIKSKFEVPDWDIKCDKNYNIIDQYLADFSIDNLRNGTIPVTDYSYKLSIGDVDVTSYGKYNAQTGYFTFAKVPISLIKGTEASITLQVISNNENWDNSELKYIGKVTLKDPNIILSQDWNKAYDFYSVPSQTTFDESQGSNYLKFMVDKEIRGVIGNSKDNSNTISDGTIEVVSENNSKLIKFNGGSRIMYLDIYKPCQITVTARTTDITNGNKAYLRYLSVLLNKYRYPENIPIYTELLNTTPQSSGSVIGIWDEKKFIITPDINLLDPTTLQRSNNSAGWKDGEANRVYIHSDGGAIHLKSISIEPL